MNRNEEYQTLLSQLEETPEALESTVQRAMTRKMALRKKRRLFGIPIGSLAACFGAFVLLVNLFPPFAMACGNVPLLRELAKAVAWSPSLSAAVENEYVQPIEQTQTANGITATVEYVIVDQKQLNVYYTLESDTYHQLEAESHAQLTDNIGYTMGSSSFGTPNGELREVRMDFMDQEIPDSLRVTLEVYSNEQTEEMAAPEADWRDEAFSPVDPWEPDYLAEFTFQLEFDPYYTAQGKTIPVNQTFTLDHQTLTVTDAEIYPTHMRLNIRADAENTAWLKGLDFYLENERGEQFVPATNGIVSSGDPESKNMQTYWLDSTYFSHSQQLTLHIIRADWLDKDREELRLNLVTGSHDPMPDGVEFIQAVQRTGGWLLTFSAKTYEEHHYYSIWAGGFRDGDGTEYEINSNSSSGSYYDEASGEYRESDGSVFYEEIPLRNFHGDELWLRPSFTRITVFSSPVAVPIK